jgi:hypothetical protein
MSAQQALPLPFPSRDDIRSVAPALDQYNQGRLLGESQSSGKMPNPTAYLYFVFD